MKAEGTTEASGCRDQAGLAARKRRVGAVRSAVPAQNDEATAGCRGVRISRLEGCRCPRVSS